MIWVGLAFAVIVFVALASIVMHLLVRSEQSQVDVHRMQLRLNAHDKLLGQLQQDAGLEDAMLATWRRRAGNSG